MRSYLLYALLLLPFALLGQQKAFKGGEWFKFRVHYGWVTAGYATLEVTDTILNKKPVHHVVGYGRTTGLSRAFFKVEDNYETYMDKEEDIPYRFIRQIDEGGHTKDIQIDFDYDRGEALVHNKKHQTKEWVEFPADAQDMVSAFYYLRNQLDVSNLKEGDTIDLNMFFDKENYVFRLKFLGREILDTEFGDVGSLVFRPYVQSGRVFQEKESLTVWVSDDRNKIPLLIKANLAVGSLKASLVEFKGLKDQFRIIFD